jgi:nucleoside-diphosphate-sugar epimerase
LKVLVTGATGFIGSHLIDRLLERGDDVTAFARPAADASGLAQKGVRVIAGDVRDEREVERAVHGAEIVYHLARAKSHGARPMSEVRAVNIDGTSNVARAATQAGSERIVYASSAAVYGSRPGQKAVDEDSVLRPDSPYARTKAEGEVRLREHAGVPVVVARITSVLGPGCRSWLPIFRSVAARRLRLVGRGNTRHHPADVSDIVDGLVLCGTVSRAAGGVYNLAGPEPITVGDMMRAIASELHVQGELPRSVPAGAIELYLSLNRFADGVAGLKLPRVDSIAFLTSDRTLDISRARKELAYTPRVGIRAAITRTAEWGRNEGLL